MNKDFAILLLKRFGKGLLAAIGAFCILFLGAEIPLVQQMLPNVIHSPVTLAIATGALLALEKWLQGYNPQ